MKALLGLISVLSPVCVSPRTMVLDIWNQSLDESGSFGFWVQDVHETATDEARPRNFGGPISGWRARTYFNSNL